MTQHRRHPLTVSQKHPGVHLQGAVDTDGRCVLCCVVLCNFPLKPHSNSETKLPKSQCKQRNRRRRTRIHSSFQSEVFVDAPLNKGNALQNKNENPAESPLSYTALSTEQNAERNFFKQHKKSPLLSTETVAAL